MTAALSLAALSGLAQGWPVADTAAAATACDCYKATADSTAHFANRKFFDFRNIADPGTPAPIAAGRLTDEAAGLTHPYFSTAEWADTWSIQSWDSPGEGVQRVNSANNIFIAASDDNDDCTSSSSCTTSSSHLTLRTHREPDYQSTAEVESIASDYQFLTVRMRARTRGSPGAVTALFTYGSDTQEADIEIRTSLTGNNNTVVQYTNQPGTTDGEEQEAATRVVTLSRPWTEWQEHRYDWTPGSSDWYADGVNVASVQYQTPTVPLSVILNVWSDGGVWSGVMDVGGEAEMQIQWLDLTYNRTSQQQPGVGAAGACSNVCVIDDLIT
jgi:hypothetical protein